MLPHVPLEVLDSDYRPGWRGAEFNRVPLGTKNSSVISDLRRLRWKASLFGRLGDCAMIPASQLRQNNVSDYTIQAEFGKGRDMLDLSDFLFNEFMDGFCTEYVVERAQQIDFTNN